MKEVSCRVVEMLFGELEKRGLPSTLLLDGVAYPEAHFRDSNERIEWSVYTRVLENAHSVWTDDELIALGGAWIEAPFLRHVRVIAGALFTPKQFYEWMAAGMSPGKKVSRRGGSQVFTCVTMSYADLGKDRLSIDVSIDEDYAPCPGFFLLSRGGFTAIPRLVGKAAAKLSLTPIDRGYRFDVQLPAGSDRRSLTRRALGWVRTPGAAARELDDAHSALQVRYDEISAARERLAVQAAQLRTAHVVNELIQRNLDLDLTLEAIANALVTEAGFARVRVELDVEVDALKIVRSIEIGAGGVTPLERVLEGRGGRKTGTLTAYTHDATDVEQRSELLAFIVPSVAMALDDAISYRVVEEYRRGLELRVAERTAELSHARDALAETVNDLEAAKEARDRIFANINHDLRSPLTLILLAVAEARRSPAFAAGGERTLGAIEHGARRVLRMVDELLILAEGREGEVRLWTTLCDIGEMVDAVANAWRPAAHAAELVLESDPSPSGLLVRADRNAIDRILANLVSNAVKFTPKGGTIRMRVVAVPGGSDNERVHVEVRDSGPGIDPDLRSRLFGRFERGSGAKRSAISGSGLGLSLVKELTEAHGGTVGVTNAPEGGAVFVVELPRSTGEIIASGDASPRQASLRPSDYGAALLATQVARTYEPSGTPRATLLLAEDDPDLRERTAMLLAEDYRVLAAPNGRIALELARTHSPDMLVTDVAMPEMDGIELTKRFKALPSNRLAPVLVLSTFGNVGDRLSGFEAGAVDYIHKPFEPAELRARVRSQLTLRSLALQLLETEKLAALGTLSAGLAHEIRNPANGIINAVGPLRELLPPEAIPEGSPAAQLLDIVEHCSRQVAAMSRQLLGFKRNVEPARHRVQIETLVTRVCTTVSPSLEGIELRERIDYQGSIHCAEPLLAQVLTNLVQNGAHAAGRGGWVEIRTGIEEQRVFVEVRDSGPGVPEALRERIFEPFFTTKPAGSGTGLGLSTARDIMLRHNGTLDVRQAGQGSVFRLEIPLES